jgi:hypothetical protein
LQLPWKRKGCSGVPRVAAEDLRRDRELKLAVEKTKLRWKRWRRGSGFTVAAEWGSCGREG